MFALKSIICYDETAIFHIFIFSRSIKLYSNISDFQRNATRLRLNPSFLRCQTKGDIAIGVSTKRDGHINRLYKYHSSVKIDK